MAQKKSIAMATIVWNFKNVTSTKSLNKLNNLNEKLKKLGSTCQQVYWTSKKFKVWIYRICFFKSKHKQLSYIPSMPCNQIHQTSKMSKIYLHMNLWTYKQLNHKINLSNQITYKFATPKHKSDMSKIWIIHEIPNHITHTMSTTFLMKPRIDFKSKTKLIVIK